MTCGAQQIVNAYETLDMSPEDIAKEQELDILSIKACLCQFSEKYRADITNESTCRKANGISEQSNVPATVILGFTEQQERMALDTIANLAQYSDDENVQLRAAKYIRDDRTGRMDFANKMGSLNVNVFAFNEQLRKAMSVVKVAKEPVVNVSSTKELVTADESL